MAISYIPSTKKKTPLTKKITRNFSDTNECIRKPKPSKLIDRTPRFATTGRKSAASQGFKERPDAKEEERGQDPRVESGGGALGRGPAGHARLGALFAS